MKTRRPFYASSSGEVLDEMASGQRGLNPLEAQRRLEKFGPNKLAEARRESLFRTFLSQFQSPLIYILLLASAVVFALGETTDGFIILFVLLFNAVVGTAQEGRAQGTLAALRKVTETPATVIRDGETVVLTDYELVPGDVILLEEGARVPADARVLLANNLKLDEAALTGESEPVHKIEDTIRTNNAGLAAAEQRNMVFKGTLTLAGNGRAVITATGTETVIGKISKTIASVYTEIPLAADIRRLSRLIIIAVLAISSTLFVFGVISGKGLKEMFTTMVGLSVSIIPEGLPIVLSLVLATGVWRMSKRNALVKKLQAVEALGQARVLAVDKTGTVTQNEMVVQKVFVDGRWFEVGGAGYEPKGEIVQARPDDSKESILLPDFPELLLAAKAAAFGATARLYFSESDGAWRVSGDPTEGALLVFGEKAGFKRSEVEKNHPLLDELPFDYHKKYHAVIRRDGGRNFLAVVGAPEKVIEISQKIRRRGENLPFSQKDKKEAGQVFSQMSGQGLRVLALAVDQDAPSNFSKEKLTALAFVGFYGMRDAIRPEAKAAIRQAEGAGMRVVMITGDHRLTAEAVARELGILKEESGVITGDDLEKLSERELDIRLGSVAVFARVTPEHKMAIIQAYRRRGEIVAMTGDGVNDAPSLVAADLGVAMGKIGTEVAKEAADIVILDDNLSSIVAAIEEGRSIYKTLQKVVLYLFSTSLGEVLVIAGAMALGWPLPILAGQILWLNLVTDGFLDVALAMEAKEKGLLGRDFEKPKKYLVSALMARRMILMALPMMIGTLLLFGHYFETDLAKAWTVALTVLAVFQWFNAWNCRSENKSIFAMNPFSNKFLVGATIIIILLQLAAVYTPFMQRILRTVPLSLYDWAVIVLVAFSIIAAEEVRKFVYRRKGQV